MVANHLYGIIDLYMNTDIYKTGTMVRPLFLESKGHLKSLFNNLKFTTSGTKHTYKRLIVFSSFMKAILEDREHQIVDLHSNQKQHNRAHRILYFLI